MSGQASFPIPSVSNIMVPGRMAVMEENSGSTHCELASADATDRNEDPRAFHPWVSESLFMETRRVWSRAYGREVSDTEVIEILVNVRRLTETLLNAARGGKV